MPDALVIELRVIGAVAAGGAVGSVLRHALTSVLPTDPLEVGVVVANLAGAFLIGLAAGRATTPLHAAFLRVGVLGSFTTFSAVMVQTAALPAPAATAYVVGHLLLGVACAAAGLHLSGGPSAQATR